MDQHDTAKNARCIVAASTGTTLAHLASAADLLVLCQTIQLSCSMQHMCSASFEEQAGSASTAPTEITDHEKHRTLGMTH